MNVGAFVIRDAHVALQGRGLIRHIWRKLTRDGKSRENRIERHKVYRDAMAYRAKEQDMVNHFRL